MSSPGDRFEDRPDEGHAWQEPAHLGDTDGDDGPVPVDPPAPEDVPAPDGSPPAADPDQGAAPTGWQPAGWDLPPAEPERPGPPAPPARGGGLFGGGLFGGGASGGRDRGPAPQGERTFADAGDPFGVLAWAMHQGWAVSDGSGPGDAPLRELVSSAPVRPSKDDRPGNVLRGRLGGLEVVAFDIVYASGRYLVPRYAVTAVPMLGAVPWFRLSPARLWKHGIAGLVPVPSGNEAFDARWQLLAGEDSAQLQRLVQDPVLQGLLLGSDDGDEFWSAAGHVAAVRPDGHRPLLVEHQARLLAALVAALASG